MTPRAVDANEPPVTSVSLKIATPFVKSSGASDVRTALAIGENSSEKPKPCSRTGTTKVWKSESRVVVKNRIQYEIETSRNPVAMNNRESISCFESD
jgi:hypothetical protein